MTIREWLDELGLTKYAAVFETEEVDVEVLPSLTEEDLAGLGIPLGPRRKIQTALENNKEAQNNRKSSSLRNVYDDNAATLLPKQKNSDPLQEEPQFPSSKETRATKPALSSTEAERRQSTVMFCELKDDKLHVV